VLDGPCAGDDGEKATPKYVQCSSCVGGGDIVDLIWWSSVSCETLRVNVKGINNEEKNY